MLSIGEDLESNNMKNNQNDNFFIVDKFSISQITRSDGRQILFFKRYTEKLEILREGRTKQQGLINNNIMSDFYLLINQNAIINEATIYNQLNSQQENVDIFVRSELRH